MTPSNTSNYRGKSALEIMQEGYQDMPDKTSNGENHHDTQKLISSNRWSFKKLILFSSMFLFANIA